MATEDSGINGLEILIQSGVDVRDASEDRLIRYPTGRVTMIDHEFVKMRLLVSITGQCNSSLPHVITSFLLSLVISNQIVSRILVARLTLNVTVRLRTWLIWVRSLAVAIWEHLGSGLLYFGIFDNQTGNIRSCDFWSISYVKEARRRSKYTHTRKKVNHTHTHTHNFLRERIYLS